MAVGWRNDTVHGRAQQRQLEPEGVDLPGDVDVLGITGPAAGDDRDVVEPVCLSPRLEDADLDIRHSACPPAFYGAGTAHGPHRHVNSERRADTPTIHHFTPSGSSPRPLFGGFHPDPSPAPGAPTGVGCAPPLVHAEGLPQPAGRRMTRSSSWSIRVVAPRIISPSTRRTTRRRNRRDCGDGAPRKLQRSRQRSGGRPDHAGDVEDPLDLVRAGHHVGPGGNGGQSGMTIDADTTVMTG